MHQTLPTKAPSSASTFWLETVQHLSERQANSPDPRTRSLNGQEFLKKNRSKGDAASVMRERVHCQGMFGTRDLQRIGHAGPDLTRPQVNHALTSRTQTKFCSKVQHLSSKMTALETSSHTLRHVGNSRNRPCGYLCFNFEETFNLQIQCQQTATVVVACKTFSLPESL